MTNKPTNNPANPLGAVLSHKKAQCFSWLWDFSSLLSDLFKHYSQEKNPFWVCVFQIARGHLWIFQLFGTGWIHLPISKGKDLESSGTAFVFFLTMSWSANEWKLGRLNVPYYPQGLIIWQEKQALAEHSWVYSESQRLHALGSAEALLMAGVLFIGVCFVSVLATVSGCWEVGGETYNASGMLTVSTWIQRRPLVCTYK